MESKGLTLNSNTIDEALLRRYLLGELSEEEQVRQEEQFLTEDQYFELLLLVEEDLIDDYVHGKLSQQDIEKVEQRFLSSSERRERVKLARDLRRYASDRPSVALREQDFGRPRDQQDRFTHRPASTRRRIALLLLAGTALLVMAGAVGLFAEMAKLRNRINSLSQEQVTSVQREVELGRQLAEQEARGEELSQKLKEEESRRIQLQHALSELGRPISSNEGVTGTGLLSLSLDPGRTRDSGQSSIIEIPLSARWLRLRMSLEQDRYRSYRATLQTDEGVQVWKRDHLLRRRLKADKMVEAVLPANLLVPGDYSVLLSPTTGRERIGTYYFTVVRQR